MKVVLVHDDSSFLVLSVYLTAFFISKTNISIKFHNFDLSCYEIIIKCYFTEYTITTAKLRSILSFSIIDFKLKKYLLEYRAENEY